MSSRKFLAVWKKGSLPAYLAHRMWGADLPEGYQAVKYLMCTGTQYIIPPNVLGKHRLLIDAEGVTLTSGSQVVISLNGGTNTGQWAGTNRTAWSCGSETGALLPFSYTTRRTIQIEWSGSWMYLACEGQTATRAIPVAYEELPIRFGSPATDYRAYVKLYTFKAWDKETNALISHCVPCVRTSDEKPGFYDKASQRFVVNVGKDEFVLPDAPYTLRPYEDAGILD